MGRSASGVRGMMLRGADDEVIALRVPREGDSLLVVTEQGFGKRTPVDEYRVKGRGTMGVPDARPRRRSSAAAAWSAPSRSPMATS